MIDFNNLQPGAKLYQHPENINYRVLSLNHETNTAFCIYQAGNFWAKGPVAREVIEELHWKPTRRKKSKDAS